LKVHQDISYSSIHPRNVLDSYELTNKDEKSGDLFPGKNKSMSVIQTPIDKLPLDQSVENDDMKPIIIFIHGGMWLKGDKSHSGSTISELAYQSLSKTLNISASHKNNDKKNEVNRANQNESTQVENSLSKIGLTLSLTGARVMLINYRLASTNFDQSFENEKQSIGKNMEGVYKHPDQVMDVARSIAFIIKKHKKVFPFSIPKIIIGGHSAGAHLGSLVLSTPKYIQKALEERNINNGHEVAKECVSGFFGISGVYNLSRLNQNVLSGLTIAPAFGKDKEKLLNEASPIQILLRNRHKILEGDADIIQSKLKPFISHVPILLLNAEQDLGLEKDAKEMMIALNSLSTSQIYREHLIMGKKNHLSIMKELGEEWENVTGRDLHLRDTARDRSFEYQMYEKAQQFYHEVLNYIRPREADETAMAIFNFIKQHVK